MVEKIDWHITITKAHVDPSESLPQVSKVYFFILEVFYEHMLRGTLIKYVQELKKNEKILSEIMKFPIRQNLQSTFIERYNG